MIMKITREEFRRYTNGQSSAAEKAKIERWLHEQEGELEEAPGENYQLRSAWDKLSTNIEDKVKVIDVAVQGKPAIQRLSFIIGLAASLILVLGLGWYIYQQDRSALPIEKQASLKTVRTEAGQRLTLTLSDGSHIVLNGKSELEYPLQFEGAQRLVKLRGEALFDIAHDPNKPFIIHTDSTFTQVLGTRFNLKAYAEDRQVLLTVERGKVRFGRYAQSDQVLLTAGMQGVMNFHEPVLSRNVETTDAVAWTEDAFVIKNEPLEAVAKRLERRYGVKIIIESKALKTLTVTGTFKKTSLDNMMSSLAFSTGIKYTIDNKTITIR